MSLALRALMLTLLTALLVASGYRWGAQATADRFGALQAEQLRASNARLLREVDRGNVAAAELNTALAAQGASYQSLERAFHDVRKRVSLVVRGGVPGAGAGAGQAAAVAGAAPAGGAAAPADGAAAPGCILVLPDASDQLSAMALWMWNSALAGRDQPAGACGLADTSSESCAAGTGISLDDAWANHATNAALCAEDRLRHQHLIDFILKGQTR